MINGAAAVKTAQGQATIKKGTDMFNNSS